MMAKLLFLLAFASYVPTIDVHVAVEAPNQPPCPGIGQALIRGAFGTSR
jgi:hypothetical protein